MPNWKKVLVSGSDALLNSLTVSNGITGSLFGTSSWAQNSITSSYSLTSSFVNTLNQNVLINGSLNVTASFTASGLLYPTTDGAFEFQVIQTDAAGTLSFGDVTTTYDIVYNGEATSIVKGTPLYISGSQGANPKVYRSDAANPAKMPVIYIASEEITSASTGRGIMLGEIDGLNLTGYADGIEVYAAVGGGWTDTRPTGSNTIIQLLGVVTKGGSGGKGLVLNPGPATLPNIQTGYVWVGDSNSYPIPVSTSSLLVNTSSYSITASFAQTASYYGGSIVSASYASTASYVLSASFALTASHYGGSVTSASYASTASYVLSASFSSTASIATQALSASYALTASVATQALSASYSMTASVATQALSASYALTASYVLQTVSASYALTSSQALSASYAPSTPTFPFTGSATITGSLNVIGSITGSLQGTASFALRTSLSSSLLGFGDTSSQLTGSNTLTTEVNASYTRIYVKSPNLGGYTYLYSDNSVSVIESNKLFVINGQSTSGLYLRSDPGGPVITYSGAGSSGFSTRLEKTNGLKLGGAGSSGTANASSNYFTVDGGNSMFGENITALARVHIKGSGATSATTNTLIQNSSAVNLFKITDDGRTTITGSLGITGGITGSLQGTASYAIQALSASYAPNTGGTVNSGTTPRLAYYASTGTAVSDTANLEYDGTNLQIKSTGQIGFYTDSGTIYFGNFSSPSYGRAGFSVPGASVMVIDYSNARAGFGGGTNLITSAPGGLVEIQGKADEIQLLIKGNSSQGNNVFEIRDSGGSPILTLDNAGVFNTAGGGTSDQRKKQNIVYITDSTTSIIENLKPVKFEFKTNPGITRHGFIAQDVLSTKPDLVLGDGAKEEGTYGLDYDGILALTIKSLQEALARIDQLEKAIKDIQG
jgi:hypothetical protein